MTRPFLALALFSLAGSASAGVGCSTGIPDGCDAKIIGGSPDGSDHPYVCSYTRRSSVGHFFAHCSATLIGPRVALTAAHCAWSGTSERMLDGLSCSAEIDPDGEWRNIRSGQLYVDPQYRSDSESHDFALIVLDTDAFDPMQMRAMLRAHADELDWSPYAQLPRADQLEHATMTAVGYGVTDKHQDANLYAHTRREAMAGFNSAGSETFRLDSHVCYSDSGGPALRGRIVYGVLSSTTGVCSGDAIYSRADSASKRAFLAAHGVSVP